MENNNVNNPPFVPNPNEEQPRNAPNNFGRIPFLAEQNNVDPRTMNFINTMRSIFCPFMKPISFIFMMSVIDGLVFFVTIIHSISTEGLETNGIFLAPNNGTLVTFGARVSMFNP